MRKYGKKAQDKVEKAMHEFKEGTLKSGKSGKKVKNPKQAVAIGLAGARKEGAKLPRPPKKIKVTAGKKKKKKATATKKKAGTKKKTKSATKKKSTAKKKSSTRKRTARKRASARTRSRSRAA